MFSGMDSEARVYLALLVVLAVLAVGLSIALARTSLAADRAAQSAQAAVKAAIKAAGERDALRGILAQSRTVAAESPTRPLPQVKGRIDVNGAT